MIDIDREKLRAQPGSGTHPTTCRAQAMLERLI